MKRRTVLTMFLGGFLFGSCATVHEPSRLPPIVHVPPTCAPIRLPPPALTGSVIEPLPPLEQVDPIIPHGSTVLLVGDSLAVGMSTQFATTARVLGYVPVAVPRSGTTVRLWETRIVIDLVKHRPKLVVVSLGTNDAVAGPIDRKRFEHLVEIIEATGAVVVWVEPPAVDKTKVRRIDDARAAIESAASHVFHSEQLTLTPLDGIHVSGMDYRRWTIALWSWMIEVGLVTPSE